MMDWARTVLLLAWYMESDICTCYKTDGLGIEARN